MKRKTEINILIAFILNLAFSVFEYVGGLVTGSVAILSDSVHDIGDAASIGISYLLERRSKKQSDSTYTYGYLRFSVLGGFITTVILIIGSVLVIIGAVKRLLAPVPINYDGMIIFAVVGVVLNFIAAWFTREGDSVNQKAVNLHMMEDVLGWIVVLIGAIIMRFTDISVIDPILSIGVSLFILINAFKNLKEVGELFLEKIPAGISAEEITARICETEGVEGVHHLHIWSMDGVNHYATMHIVTNADMQIVKAAVREKLSECGIGHVTLEMERSDECCCEHDCHAGVSLTAHHHHHH